MPIEIRIAAGICNSLILFLVMSKKTEVKIIKNEVAMGRAIGKNQPFKPENISSKYRNPRNEIVAIGTHFMNLSFEKKNGEITAEWSPNVVSPVQRSNPPTEQS